ncbi:MAG TPA: glycosyltransferase family 39 protein [Patescibacteria group bacterium]|nr:glycosyltransferase family 39 protein [Patescibacteria group bacterium]
MKKRYLLILLAIAGLGFYLRFKNLDQPYLWQDEAESAIYALQILETGYPHSEFRGETLYENKLLFLGDGEKYQYQSTNFFGSKYEKNKGWLPYYLMALSFKALGVDNFSARLPSVLISVLTIILIYFLAKEFFSSTFSLCAAFLYAINYAAIYYERQARYYSLEIFLVILSLYLFYLFLKTKKDKFLFLTSVGLILLFHTHIVIFLTMAVFFAGYYFYKNPGLLILKNKIFWLSAIFFLASTIPWLILVNFLEIFSYALINFYDKLVILIFIIFNLFLLLAIKFLYQYVVGRKINLDIVAQKFIYLILFLIFGIFTTSLFLPEESLASRSFVWTLPILLIFLVYCFIIFLKTGFKFISIVLFSFFLTWFLFFFSPFGFIQAKQAEIFKSAWVEALINYLKLKRVPTTTLILTSHDQFSLMFYSDYAAQLIWPINCSYLKNYPSRLIFATKGKINPVSFGFNYFGEQAPDKFFELFNCFTYDKNCQTAENQEVTIYDCRPKEEPK